MAIEVDKLKNLCYINMSMSESKHLSTPNPEFPGTDHIHTEIDRIFDSWRPKDALRTYHLVRGGDDRYVRGKINGHTSDIVELHKGENGEEICFELGAPKDGTGSRTYYQYFPATSKLEVEITAPLPPSPSGTRFKPEDIFHFKDRQKERELELNKASLEDWENFADLLKRFKPNSKLRKLAKRVIQSI
jgi:hypothetical protein